MGAYSEMDIDLRYGDSPFEESGTPAQNIPAFVEEPPMALPTTPPAVAAAETPAERDTTPPPATPAQKADTVPTETSNDAGKPAEATENTASEADKLLYLKQRCNPCETLGCCFNYSGECRFPLVHERMPRLTATDDCKEYDYRGECEKNI